MCKLWYICVALAAAAVGCKPQGEPEPTEAPAIVSVTCTDVTLHGASLSAVLSGHTDGARCGFELSSPSGTSAEYIAEPQDSTITCLIDALASGTTFAYKAFIDNLRGGRICSEEQSFTTLCELGPDPEPEPDPNPDPDPGELITIEDAFFKNWLIIRYDQDGNGEISITEGRRVDNIEINGDNLHSVAGIEHFPNLEHLQVGGTCRDTYGLGGLTEMDVSSNPRLLRLGLEGNQIAHLDISNNTRLTYLSVSRNPLEEICVTKLPYLTVTGMSYTNIKTLDLRGLNVLEEVHLDGCYYLEELLLSNNKMWYLDCSQCALKTLDISKCPRLNEFHCDQNPSLLKLYMSRGQAISHLCMDEHTEIIYVD